ncbi:MULTISPECIES: lysylphosphatidylglycerol synthase transmembrane domain-containing protein [Persephonella]|uniref:Putative membrane protein n=1 Tax=Persephonella marina (strain DSM 14350 / EX-H1) TaxID=123214 RepID=C0QPJ1_PERMH|nr:MULTISPECIES: lysylphosphatidylglycerol synthase transmembrane domain-containing protein [Persephonella]ACO03496.1 putative membrane protein [Persephonella marina EX-H1]
MKKYIKIFELIVSLAVTGGFIYLFYVVIGFEKLIYFLKKVSPTDLFIAFILYLFSYITRTYRWKITLEIKDFKKLFKITSFNTVFNIFLPFRTGELSFFYMLKKENVPFKESAISFFTVRFFDAVSLFTVFLSSYLVYKGFTLFSLLLVLVMPFSFYIIKFMAGYIKIEKLQNFNRNVLTVKNILVLYILSVLTFVFKFSGFYFVIPHGIDLTFIENFFAAAAGDFTTILPIHGVAGIGTYEGGYAGILYLSGLDKDTALLSSVFVHIFILIGAAFIAGFSYIFLRK